MTLASTILAKKTRLVLERDPMSIVAIMNGIASPRKIARRIIADIKAELEFEPKLESVAKIVERYVETVESSGRLAGYDVEALKAVFAKTHVILRSDIAVLGVRITKDTDQKLARLMQYIHTRKEKPFLNITYGHTYVTLILDQRIFDRAIRTIGKRNIVYHRRNQAALSIVTPSDVLNVPGFSGHALSLLGLSGINVAEILSSYNEGITILDEKDASNAYNVLRTEIDRLRRQLGNKSIKK
jgi:hypothetical protein